MTDEMLMPLDSAIEVIKRRQFMAYLSEVDNDLSALDECFIEPEITQ